MSDSGRKMTGLVWLLIIAGTGASLALGTDFFISKIPWSIEEKLSLLVPLDPGLAACLGPKDSLAALSKIEARLRAAYPEENSFAFQISVLPSSEVNAFAFLGGHIYIYLGLIKQAQSAEELAGVISHEIEHVKRRHILQGVLVKYLLGSLTDHQIVSTLMNLHFSRKQEQEADEGGLHRLLAANIETKGFQQFFERLQKSVEIPAILSDHPTDESRSLLAKKYSTARPVPILNENEWLQLRKVCN